MKNYSGVTWENNWFLKNTHCTQTCLVVKIESLKAITQIYFIDLKAKVRLETESSLFSVCQYIVLLRQIKTDNLD